LIDDIDKKYLPDINKVASHYVYKKAKKALYGLELLIMIHMVVYVRYFVFKNFYGKEE